MALDERCLVVHLEAELKRQTRLSVSQPDWPVVLKRMPQVLRTVKVKDWSVVSA